MNLSYLNKVSSYALTMIKTLGNSNNNFYYYHLIIIIIIIIFIIIIIIIIIIIKTRLEFFEVIITQIFYW